MLLIHYLYENDARNRQSACLLRPEMLATNRSAKLITRGR